GIRLLRDVPGDSGGTGYGRIPDRANRVRDWQSVQRDSVGKRVKRRWIRCAVFGLLAAAGLTAAFLARAHTGPAAPPGYPATIGASGKPVTPSAASRKLGIAS